MRLAISLITLVVLTLPRPAAARSQREVSYAYDQVFPAAVRFLRIDEGLKIVEKDAEAGYVLFELTEDGKTFKGALEVVRIQDGEGRPAVRLVIRVEDRPTYTETGILGRLVWKLQKEIAETRKE